MKAVLFCNPGGLFSVGQRLRRTLQLVDSSSELEELVESLLELLEEDDDEDGEQSGFDLFFFDFFFDFLER